MATRSSAVPERRAPSQRISVLLIDDEADSLFPVLAQNLHPLGFDFRKETDPDKVLPGIEKNIPDVILLDLRFPGDESRRDGRTTGGELLRAIRHRFDDVPVILFTTTLDDVDIPLERFENQPQGFFAKPVFARQPGWPDRLAQALHDAIETARFSQSHDAADLGFFVGQTREMREVAARIRTIARNPLTVLIYGETGSGKQLAAEAIHRLSGRKGRFEHYNCAGAHLETLDSTLFGHERGAFTSADRAAPGLFELADDGTLFLDELQHIPLALQNKLMIVVEKGTFRPMGATSDKTVDVRLIVATNHNLSDLVEDGVLRDDLAHRLGVSLIALPSLRRRLGDLPELFRVFVVKANAATGRSVLEILRPETREKLEQHAWPGNIRELEATVLRAVAQTNSNVLLPQDIVFLPVGRARSQGPEGSVAAVSGPSAEIAPDAQQQSLVASLTDHLERLAVAARYGFLKKQDRELQCAVLEEFVCRLRRSTGRRISHKELAAVLDPLAHGERDFNKIRQFLHACGLKLTNLACNQ